MAEAETLVASALQQRWPLHSPNGSSDKDERGRVVVIGGAAHTPGAVLLAGIAALRVGAGKLTIATTEPTAAALAVAVPEAGVIPLLTTGDGAISREAVKQAADLVGDVDAVLIGPGMADPEATRGFIADLLDHVDPTAVLVLDAMATSCGVLKDGLGPVAARTVITPNSSEAEYLLDDTRGEEPEIAVRIATAHGVTTALGSSVATAAGECWTIPKGNAGLGTSGSGDVLAGAVVGIAARTHEPVMAAAWGLTLHGASGDRLAARIGQVGFLARELLDELPRCLQALSS